MNSFDVFFIKGFTVQNSNFCISTAGEHVEQLQDLIKDLEKQQYLPHYWLDKGTVVNRELSFLHDELFEIKLTTLLTWKCLVFTVRNSLSSDRTEPKVNNVLKT